MDLFSDTTNLFQRAPERCWGLDLGTFRSCLAFIPKDGSAPPKVPEYQDACLGGVPSLFSRNKKGQEHVADQVLDYGDLEMNPAGVCASVKTRLAEKSIVLHGHSYLPREILVRIVRRVLEVSADLLMKEYVTMDIPELVVGVPVRFGAGQRGEIQSIVQEALGGKPVQLVPEPILAALTNDYFLRRSGQYKGHPLLVFDMGAGTFDTVVLQPNPKPTADSPFPYEAVNPLGMPLAGDRMDQLMEELMLEKLRSAPGTLNLALLEDTRHQDRIKLRGQARLAKERLSKAEATDLPITTIQQGSAQLHITRAEYEARIRPDIQKAVDLAAKAVEDAGLWGAPVLDILLVGGSTYIPLVRKLLLERFSWLKDSQIMQRFPEKAVAMGAAIYAAQPKLVLPKVAYGYAVRTYNTTQKRSMLHVRIPSNAKLPMQITGTYRTRFADQTNIRFDVYEVDHGEPDEFLELREGKELTQGQQPYGLTHKFSPDGSKHVPRDTRVRLTVTLTPDGLLSMKIDDFGISPAGPTEGTIRLDNVTT